MPRIRLVTAPKVVMKTHLCHIAVRMSAGTGASMPAPSRSLRIRSTRAETVPSCSPKARCASGASRRMAPEPSRVVTTLATPPRTAGAPKRVLRASMWARPLRSGMTAVSGPTAGATSSIARSSPVDFTDSRTRSNGSRSSSAVTRRGSTVHSSSRPTTRSPRSRSAAARAGRTRKVTSSPARASIAPK
ncbi:hypothetical protein STANM309S_02008 [Streptomyces tanashiensis]